MSNGDSSETEDQSNFLMPLDPSQLGSSGAYRTVVVAPIYVGESDVDMGRMVDTEERVFSVTVLLNKYERIEQTIDVSFSHDDGSSYLKMPDGVRCVVMESTNGKFVIISNRHGEYSSISMDVRANTHYEARFKFLATITPMLDHLSYLTDTPVITQILRVIDLKNNVQKIHFVEPYYAVLIKDYKKKLEVNFLPIYSMYREANTSTSPYYRLLCFYKIIDGIYALKAKLAKSARKKLHQSAELSEDVVPDHPNLAEDLRVHVGKSVKSFQDKVVTRRFRDAVAHFLKKDESILHVSSPEETIRFSETAFACRLCVREMIKNYEKDLIKLGLSKNSP